jgi:hypothetical protein
LIEPSFLSNQPVATFDGWEFGQIVARALCSVLPPQYPDISKKQDQGVKVLRSSGCDGTRVSPVSLLIFEQMLLLRSRKGIHKLKEKQR